MNLWKVGDPMSVPNLDALSHNELTAFWVRHQGGRSRKEAEFLVGDRRKGYTIIAAQLANYAINKATAIDCRLRGDTQAALVYEQICDLIYERLPRDVRW